MNGWKIDIQTDAQTDTSSSSSYDQINVVQAQQRFRTTQIDSRTDRQKHRHTDS